MGFQKTHFTSNNLLTMTTLPLRNNTNNYKLTKQKKGGRWYVTNAYSPLFYCQKYSWSSGWSCYGLIKSVAAVGIVQWILHKHGGSHVDVMAAYMAAQGTFFLAGTSVYNLKLCHRGAEMIHNWEKKKAQSFLFWQERCDQERETRKTKCFAVFEKWLTTEDQSNWQPKCCYPCWLFVSMLIHTFWLPAWVAVRQPALKLYSSICVLELFFF